MSRRDLTSIAAGLLYAFIRMPAWNPYPLQGRADDTWLWFMHEVWSRPIACGDEFIWTYGPYGFLVSAFMLPKTMAAAITLRTFLATAAIGNLFTMLRRGGYTAVHAAVFTVVIFEITCVGRKKEGNMAVECLLFLLEWLAIMRFWPLRSRAAATDRLDRLCGLLLWPALAIAAQIKFTHVAVVCCIVGIGSVWEVTRRRVPYAGLLVVASWLAWWKLAGQRLADIPAYVRHSIEMAAGYSAGWSQDGPLWQPAFFLVAAAGFMLVHAKAQKQRLGWAGVLPVTAAMGLVFPLFKACFVCGDTHAMLIAALAAWSVLTCLLLTKSQASDTDTGEWRLQPRWAVALLVLLLAGMEAIFWQQKSHGFLERLASNVLEIPSRVRSAALALCKPRTTADWASAQFAAIRHDYPLPSRSGTWDVMTSDALVLAANGLPYQPRPVIQSYAALTPALLQGNVEFLRSQRAPDNMALRLLADGDRWPAIMESACWLELVSRYEMVEVNDPAVRHVVMQRRAARPSAAFEPLASRAAVMGKELAIGEDGPIWAEIDVQAGAMAKFAQFAFKLPPLTVRLVADNGAQWEYRFAPQLARAGLLISPVVATTEDWRRWLRDPGNVGRKLPRLKTLTIRCDDWSRSLYVPEIAVKLSRIRFPDAAAVPN
jgi:hypothetical protein